MSVILRPDFPSTAEQGVRTLCDTLSAAAKPHRINVYTGAEPEDIAHTARQCDLLFDLFLSGLRGQLENLHEHLPIKEADFTDIYGALNDLRSEVSGRLQNIEDTKLLFDRE